MPAKSLAHFLGLELATEQLRAVIVDEELNFIGTEAIDFDTDLTEYQTRGGVFTTPGDAYTTPVEMWVKSLDMLLTKLRDGYDLSKIKSIGGSAQHATVWWTPDSVKHLAKLNPKELLHTQLTSATFSLLHTPVAQDTSTLAQSQALELALGGPDAMAQRVGTSAHLSLTAAQAMKIREGNPDAWARTGRMMLASAFLCSVLLGAWAPMGEAEVAGTGLWGTDGGKANWDDLALELVAGSKEEAKRFRDMLGPVESYTGKKVGNISPYYVERFGFSADTFLTPFTSDHLSAYLSLCPSSTDTIISFGSMDALLTPAPHYLPSRLYTLYPHPAQDPAEKRKYLAMLLSRNADVPRALVRDMYTKSWSAFDRLVSVIPPGGSIGLDDKLFSFWVLQGESFPFSHVKGIFRFETGIKVNEFRDLRANPRCLLESQLLSFRVRYARMVSNGLFYPSRPLKKPRVAIPASNLGVAFDPYDATHLPRRILAIGSAANFPSVVTLLSDVFNAPVFVPVSLSPLESNTNASTTTTSANAPSSAAPSGRTTPTNNMPTPTPSRPSACLGGAYLARWAWRRLTRPDEKYGSFEDEIRVLLRKKWLASNLSSSGDGSTTPRLMRSASASYLHHAPRSGLAATMFNEEDEYEENGNGNINIDAPPPVAASPNATRNTNGSGTTSSTLNPPSSLSPSAALLNTSPGTLATATLGGSISSPTSTPISPITSSAQTPAALMSLSGLPTDDKDAQMGLVKVADSDHDAFLTYAAIVPEYCRLEGMLVKALV